MNIMVLQGLQLRVSFVESFLHHLQNNKRKSTHLTYQMTNYFFTVSILGSKPSAPYP